MIARGRKLILPSLALALFGVLLGLGLPALAGPKVVRDVQAVAIPSKVDWKKRALAPVAFDLCAKEGTLTLPDATTVPIWGFAIKPTGVDCTDNSVVAKLPGPVLDVPQGSSVTITLYNALSENASIVFPGQEDVAPDTTGVAPGADNALTPYTFTASQPGTFLYEAGTNAERQVPMGLYGALIVRPPTGAYGTTATAYDIESILVLSEIDPDLNADPNGFDMLDYAPTYFLISGKAYPQTAAISAAAGKKVLLRYLNAGLQHHTMTLLGTYQRIVAADAYPESFPFDAVAETIPTGSTLDAIATVPAGTASGKKLPLYERGMRVTNDSAFPGGMITFIAVP
jgi:FtsP/CotA-like multicopper oxidase with cupredoxin domain